jgi:signal transduction histidine kinase
VPQRRELVELGELARAVGAEFPGTELEAAPASCWALADPGAVARIVRILADNAHRHGNAAEPVRITAGRADDRVWLAVQDAGPGVPEAERELIFERFRRGASSAGAPGFGLGLAIGRELARGMAGDLRLDPSASGARFVLDLPAAEP